MIEFVRSRHIDAPPDRIWPYVDDVTRWPEWFTEAERCEVLEGEGVGRRQRMYGHARGKATEIDSIVTAATPPSLLRWHHEAERVDGKPGSVVYAKDATAEVAIVPDGSGSLVTYRLMAEPGSFAQHVHAAGPRAEADRTVVRDLARTPGRPRGSARLTVPDRRLILRSRSGMHPGDDVPRLGGTRPSGGASCDVRSRHQTASPRWHTRRSVGTGRSRSG